MRIQPANRRSDPLPAASTGGPWLPFGDGRSYGDSCLNGGGSLIDARPLDRSRLKPIAGPFIDQELLPFRNAGELSSLASGTDERFERTVAWLDCSAAGSSLGRGILTCGNHSDKPSDGRADGRRLTFPVTPPISLINSWSLRLFNGLYYRL